MPPVGRPLDDVQRALDVAMSEGGLRTLMQPIVDLHTDEVVGWEALTRGPEGGRVEGPDELFAAARACSRLAEVDWACRCSAFRAAVSARVRPPHRLFVNAEPQVLGTACPVHLVPDWMTAHKRLDVVVEVTERYLLDAPAELLRVAATLQELGWEVALDDVGANEAGVALLPVLRPDVVKLDSQLLVPRPSRMQRSVLGAVQAYVARSGARVVAEGVENDADRRRAVDLGADWGQGWLLGRPELLSTAPEPPGGLVPLRREGQPGADPRVPTDPFALLLRCGRAASLGEQEVRHSIEAVCLDAVPDSAGTLALVVLGGTEGAPRGLTRLLDRLQDRCALVVVLTGEAELHRSPAVRTTLLPEHDDVRRDAGVVLLGPERALAVYARLQDDGSWTGVRTGEPDAVAEAARILLARTEPLVVEAAFQVP